MRRHSPEVVSGIGFRAGASDFGVTGDAVARLSAIRDNINPRSALLGQATALSGIRDAVEVAAGVAGGSFGCAG